MKKRRIRAAAVLTAVLLLAAVCYAAYVGMYLPKSFDDLGPVRKIGLFRNLTVEQGSCTYAVPPSVRSPVQPMLRSIQSWYGKCVLSEETAAALLCSYEWEPWRITESQWNHAKETKESLPYTCFYLFEFDALHLELTDKTFLVSQAFDDEQNDSHRIGQLFNFFAPDENRILFYYTAS